MVSPIKQKLTIQDFYAFIAKPEHTTTIFELVGGEAIEVPSNPYVSKIAGWILTALNLFLREHDLGHVTGADGRYIVNGDVYAPDVAYISYARQPELAKQGFNPNPPDLAVEVISDPKNAQEQATLRRKIVNYLSAGTVVWVVDVINETVEVYDGIQQAQVYDSDDTLNGGEWLSGFTLAVKDIFPKKNT